jgi:hypothetical protein
MRFSVLFVAMATLAVVVNAAWDPVAELGGRDLACSACSLAARGIETELTKLSTEKKTKKKTKLTKRLAKRMAHFCDGLKNMAMMGPDNHREYLDMAMAMSKEKRGEKKTKLNNIKMGPEVSTGLRAACEHYSNTYAKKFDVAKEMKTARTLKDLDIHNRLCVEVGEVCREAKATKKAQKLSSKKAKYAEARPFLVGRSTSLNDRFCET